VGSSVANESHSSPTSLTPFALIRLHVEIPIAQVATAHVVLLGLPGALAFATVSIITRRTRILPAVLVGVITMTLVYAVCLLAFDSTSANVSIKVPADNISVKEYLIDVQGEVYPADANVYLLVHPKDGKYWWIQPEPIRFPGGVWKGAVSLGNSKQGEQTYYQILAMVSTNPWLVDVVRNTWLSRVAKKSADGIQIYRPPALKSSSIVTVWRSG